MRTFTNIAVIGAGTMGHGIALVCALGGKTVRLVDINTEALAKARDKMRQSLQLLADNGLAPTEKSDTILESIYYTNNTQEGIADAELIFEAVPENVSLKQSIYEQLEKFAPRDAVFASNTSGIPINTLAAMTHRADRFIGTHFFQPGHLVPLVEVIQGDNTPDELVRALLAFLSGIGKKPVWVRRDIPGFIGNRLQHAIAREAMSLMQQGVASAEDIDTVVKTSLALRMVFTGPIEQRDFNGLDVHLAITEYLYPVLEDTKTPLKILADKVAAGDLGVKAGKGFFDWRDKDMSAVNARKNQQLIDILKLSGSYD